METEVPNARIPALATFLQEHRSQAHRVLHHIIGLSRPFLLRSDLTDAIDDLCADDPALADTALARALHQCEEAAIDAAWIYLALRRRVARWDYLRIHLEAMDLQQVGVGEYLGFNLETAVDRFVAASSVCAIRGFVPIPSSPPG